MTTSYGVFVENPRSVTIAGNEFFASADNRGQHMSLINQNRIGKDKLLNKWVLIIQGPFKGQRGRVTHMNGDQATIEMSIRAKQVHIDRADIKEIDERELLPEVNE